MLSYEQTAYCLYAVQLVGMHGRRADGKVSLWIRGHPKHQPQQIFLALDLTMLLTFNGFFYYELFLRFKSTVSDSSISVKLGLVPNHGMKRMRGARLIKGGPHRDELHMQSARRRAFSLIYRVQMDRKNKNEGRKERLQFHLR